MRTDVAHQLLLDWVALPNLWPFERACIQAMIEGIKQDRDTFEKVVDTLNPHVLASAIQKARQAGLAAKYEVHRAKDPVV